MADAAGGAAGGAAAGGDAQQAAADEKVSGLQAKIAKVKAEMEKNIDIALARGEAFETLANDTAQLEEGAGQFKKNTSTVKRQMFMQRMKAGAAVAGIAVGATALAVGSLTTPLAGLVVGGAVGAGMGGKAIYDEVEENKQFKETHAPAGGGGAAGANGDS